MSNCRSKLARLGCLLAVGLLVCQPATSSANDMNKFVVQSAKYLNENYSGKGYDLNSVLTHDLPYAKDKIKATNAPRSMCVAGMIEVIVHAFEIYSKENNSDKIYKYLPASSWSSLRPTAIKSHIWVDPNLKAYGTGDALVAFGMGQRLTFSELKAGDFVNINRPPIVGHRSKASGHAVVFLSYVNAKGVDTPNSGEAAGFRYFSHQGSTNGFAEKIGFFLTNKNRTWFCPKVPNASVDCGIMQSKDQRYLNAGRLLDPDEWDSEKRDSYIAALKKRLFSESKSRGPSFLGLDTNITEPEFNQKIETLDSAMKLNPIFQSEDF